MSRDLCHAVRYFIIPILLLVGEVVLSFQAHALTISPVRFEIAGDPGQTLNGEIELLNEESETKTFYSSVQNFEARGDSGTPYFLMDTNKGLASWTSVKESVVLEAGERKTIPFTIKISPGTQGGGYFAAIFWSTTPPTQQQEGQVAVAGKLGTLILLSVTGEVKEGGGLLDFTIDGDRRMVISLPITFVYRFSNDGNARVKPIGELRIKNLLGFTAVALDANRRDGNVLPGSTRKFDTVWFERGQDKLAVFSPPAEDAENKSGFFPAAKNQLQNFAFGPYRAKLALNYGGDKNTSADFWFWVIPWQLLSIVIIILAIIGFLGTWGIKKYNRWIIAKVR
ncbi:MAG: hypothetical protein HYS57_01965 [Parcubacteria group bacterium]|nr:hypothetical protein [Parcubacteria group bacterium]